MGRRETREVATYLRNGSHWVGQFVISEGDLDFGDDRFDAAHGLARLVYAEPRTSPSEAGLRADAWNGAADEAARRKTTATSRLDARVERFKLVA